MNHQNQYNLLINKAKLRVCINGYFEKHHIIPRSLGGSNFKENIVKLTAKEHFVAHMLLAKIHGKGMWQAAIMMKNSSNSMRYCNSRLYEISKKEWKKIVTGVKRSPETIEKIKANQTPYKHSEETKQKMSEIRKGKPRPGNPNSFKHSEESKKKMSNTRKAMSNHMLLPEHRQRMMGDNNPMNSIENRLKISLAKKEYWAKKKLQPNI
jgi:hypothetical protein